MRARRTASYRRRAPRSISQGGASTTRASSSNWAICRRSDTGSGQNAFFRDLYGNLARMLRAPMHPLFGFEAREHTAQVDPDIREIRERRFRFGDREREELVTNEKRHPRGR